jgi:hypothetical protein
MASDLVPVFVPPLATLLAESEREAGRRLSEQQVEAIRDRATVVMMKPEDAERMAESRGFRDVDPEDCWADWHRLRVEHTGNGYLPKIVLCLVGDSAFGRAAAELLTAESIEYEVQERDDRMRGAFEASAFRVEPSLTARDLDAIERHDSVVYALSSNYGAGAALAEARRMLEIGGRLLEAGAAGMKCESSGIAHGRGRWLELAQSADAEALFRAFVCYPIGDGDDYYSCGLHLLGRPDLIAADPVFEDDPASLVALFQTFASYLLTECPPKRFHSGHTFRCDAESPRYVVRWEPCRGYDEDDFFFNPFGRFRFGPD